MEAERGNVLQLVTPEQPTNEDYIELLEGVIAKLREMDEPVDGVAVAVSFEDREVLTTWAGKAPMQLMGAMECLKMKMYLGSHLPCAKGEADGE